MNESSKIPKNQREMRVSGSHEQFTDTTALARGLAAGRGLREIVTAFDRGDTVIRDVGRMTTRQRDFILDSYENGTLRSVVQSHPETFTMPVQNLYNRVVHGERDQPLGHNFFVNATGFLGDNREWAHDFDRAIRSQTGRGIREIIRMSSMDEKDRALIGITQNRNLTVPCAVYLAGRSLASEQYLESVYGRLLSKTKMEVGDITGRLAGVTRLRRDMLSRAVEQLGRAQFGSFDHLNGLVTSGDTGAAGDYHIGTLRLEIQFGGTVAAPTFPTAEDARHTIAHELNHVASAQATPEVRCGLYINGQGFEADEGMTEYLARLSTESSAVQHYDDGRVSIDHDVPYRVPTAAMARLHLEQKRGETSHFATLFNAYHGDVRNQLELERALNQFYRYDAAIARYFKNQ